MTVFDYAFLGVLALSAAVGMWRGLVSEVIALLAWAVALFAAWRYAGEASALLVDMIFDPAWRQIAAFTLIFVLVLVLAALLRFLLRELLKAVGLGTADRVFGALFGAARGVAIALAVVLFGGLIGIAHEPWWSNAMFAPPLETAVIAAKPWLPDVVATKIRYR
ncbi:CvpA family protein [Aromatoleum petrolei]|uniref:CvpA family protein n=1 Tax=Aromatoleum petrolei TaxID=76116 RepID=A0ABX1MNC3_9RHOO|nr:CvpA family protein [Aromatoleum petrolei]NMF88705.1 CvpA family protein [Aromatoleum petrolei]QTQ37873.1 Colicin V production protein [Aromatoleum petrolei]